MGEEHLLVKKENAIATIMINRPDKRNAISTEMWKRIPLILKELEEDSEVKVLIIRGVNERAFAAGADISEFNNKENLSRGSKDNVVMQAEKALYYFSKPTIAMIQKYCMGGGCLLALACDLRFSSDSGVFAITPAKIGLVYSFSGTKKLVDLVGPSKAKDILFSGRRLDAQEALQYGLIDRVYSDIEIEEKTMEYAGLLTERAQRSIKGTKKIITEIMEGVSQESENTRHLIAAAIKSDDYKEGVTAFLEKRKPIFRE